VRNSASQKPKNSVIAIRGISTLSLLKLFSIGFLVGTAPFIFLLNFGMLTAPTMISDEVKRVVSFPGVLLAWPVFALAAAWVATFFASTGLRIFGRFRAIRIAVLLDDAPKA
jgi:hypothetical protein